MPTTALDQYFLGYRLAELERLQLQAMLMAEEAAWLFDRVGLRAGHSVVELGCTNVEVRVGDARATGLAHAAFDVATARLVLVNVPAPEEIVAEAVELVRPGGAVAFHEADWLSHVCDPPLPAL